MRIATLADKISAEQEMPLDARWSARSLLNSWLRLPRAIPSVKPSPFSSRAGPEAACT